MYTLDDLKAAKDELAEANRKWERYSGNNPNKFQGEIKTASSKVRLIEESLKSSGILECTEHEKLGRELDAAFPNARNREVVEHKGEKYQRKFWPVEKSRSRKSVTEWGKGWVRVKDCC